MPPRPKTTAKKKAPTKRSDPRPIYQVGLDQDTFEWVCGLVRRELRAAQVKGHDTVYPNSWAILKRTVRQLESAAEDMVERLIDSELAQGEKVLPRVGKVRRKR